MRSENVNNMPAGNAATPSDQAIETPNAIQQQLSDVDALTKDLKRLLVKGENALEKEGLREDVERLERWMVSYRNGLAAASKMCAGGTDLLCEIKDRLKLAAEELQRLEDEGGNPASREQMMQLEELVKATKLIDQVMPAVQNVFCEESQRNPQAA